MERPGGTDRPEPPQRHSGRDRPPASNAPRPPEYGRTDAAVEARANRRPPLDSSRLTRQLWDKLELEPYAARMHRPDVERLDASGQRDTPSAALRRFRPEHARLESVTLADADTYIGAHATDQPWLRAAASASPEARIVLVALAKGRGHAVQRHEGGVTPDQTDARVRRLEDPAIGTDSNRIPGRDAYKPGKTHRCDDAATRIADPDAFAVCFARGVEHPRVQDALARPAGPETSEPAPVRIPLADLLGPEGYRYCDGHRLKPIYEDGKNIAIYHRASWVDSIRQSGTANMPEPESIRLHAKDFEGAVVKFTFRPNREKTGWEIATMYVEPLKPDGDRR